MPTFLSDPSSNVYLLLGVALIISFAFWLNSRSRKALLATLFFAACIGLLYLFDKMFESPREQGVRKIQELAQATRSNPQEISRHFSDQFKYGNTTKKQINERFASIKQRWSQWSGGVVWGFDRSNFEQLSDRQIRIGFTGQAQEHPETVRYLVATFQQEADGEWRIVKIAFYDPFQKDHGAETMMNELGGP